MMLEHHSSWIFSWRRRFRRRWQLLIATLIVLPVTGILYSVMRIRVFDSQSVPAKQADLLLIADNAANHDIFVSLSQKTPFPIHSDLAEIESLSTAALNEALRTEILAPSVLREIPVKRNAGAFEVPLVLPTIDVVDLEVEKQRQSFMPQPRLRLMRAQESVEPIAWPRFVITSQPPSELRYMIHITEQGFVDQCQSMETEPSKRLAGIDAWLLSLRYPSGKNQPVGWFFCEIEWINVAP
jgi:hypothetical protein